MDEKFRTQRELVRAVLEQGESLTSLEALRRFGIARLASRICELKKRGFPVRRRMLRTAKGANIAQYFLDGPVMEGGRG